jgi:hypothetical protein
MKAAGPYEFIGFGGIDVTKPYRFIWFGDIDGPKPYEFRGPRGFYFANTGIAQFQSFGSSSKHADIGPESFGIVVGRFVGTVPDILGVVWPSFRSKSGSKSKIPGRIRKSFPVPIDIFKGR